MVHVGLTAFFSQLLDARERFGRHGEVKDMTMVLHPDGPPNRFAYVDMVISAHALMKLKGTYVRCHHCPSSQPLMFFVFGPGSGISHAISSAIMGAQPTHLSFS